MIKIISCIRLPLFGHVTSKRKKFDSTRREISMTTNMTHAFMQSSSLREKENKSRES